MVSIYIKFIGMININIFVKEYFIDFLKFNKNYILFTKYLQKKKIIILIDLINIKYLFYYLIYVLIIFFHYSTKFSNYNNYFFLSIYYCYATLLRYFCLYLI